MNRFILKVFVFFLAINLWNIGFFKPVASEFGGDVTIAEATHKGGGGKGGGGKGGDGCGKKGCTPPTVSELSIQYMVAGGLTFILASGGIIFFIRNRSKKQSSAI
jgi:hypothetical protein